MTSPPFLLLRKCTVADESNPDHSEEFAFRGQLSGFATVRPDGALEALRFISARLADPESVALPLDPTRVLEESEYWGVPLGELRSTRDSLLQAHAIMKSSSDPPLAVDVVVAPAPGPRVRCAIPEWIAELAVGNVAVCGGAAARAWAGFVAGDVGDYDLFPCGPGGWARCTAIVMALMRAHECTAVVTATAVSLRFRHTPEVLQFIRAEQPDVASVLRRFDLDICCVAFVDGAFVASERAHRAASTGFNFVNPETFGRGTMWRARRYAARGFGFAMHGARASTLKPYPGFEPSGAEIVLANMDAPHVSEELDSGGFYKAALAHPDYDVFLSEIFHYCKWVTVLSSKNRYALQQVLARRPAVEQLPRVSSAGFFHQRAAPPSFENCSEQVMYVHHSHVSELARCRLEMGCVLWENPRRPEERWREVVVHTDSGDVGQYVRATDHAIRTMQACLDVTWHGARSGPLLRAPLDDHEWVGAPPPKACDGVWFKNFMDRPLLFSRMLTAFVATWARRPSFREDAHGHMLVNGDDAGLLSRCRLVGGALLWENPLDAADTWRPILLELRQIKVTARGCHMHPALRHVAAVARRRLKGEWYDSRKPYRGEMVEQDLEEQVVRNAALALSVVGMGTRHDRYWRNWRDLGMYFNE